MTDFYMPMGDSVMPISMPDSRKRDDDPPHKKRKQERRNRATFGGPPYDFGWTDPRPLYGSEK
mgnify:CR=1 FL=1